MEIMISKLSNGYLLGWYESNYKLHREAFIKESELYARCKELLSKDEEDEEDEE